jgi:hypothetical protein
LFSSLVQQRAEAVECKSRTPVSKQGGTCRTKKKRQKICYTSEAQTEEKKLRPHFSSPSTMSRPANRMPEDHKIVRGFFLLHGNVLSDF